MSVVAPTRDLALRAFTSEKVCAITHLSKRQLQYWDEQQFLSPSISGKKTGRGRRRLYDFRDLVSLRVAADLRSAGISLQLIRRAVEHLRNLDYREPLREVRFWASGGRLFFEEAGTVREGRRPDQTIAEFAIPIREIIRDLEQQIVVLDERKTGELERRRGALGSKLLVAGTRIPVASVQRLAADGATEGEILSLYPDLSANDVRAALAEESQLRRARAS